MPFINHVKYLYVIFGKRFTWKLHIEVIEVKAFRTFIRFYSLFKSERLSANIKLTLHLALIRLIMTYACAAWEFAADTLIFEIAAPAKQGSPHHWKFPKVHTFPRFAHGVQPSVYILLYNKISQATSRGHEKSDTDNVRGLNLTAVKHTTV
jgi:hypothetical protein